jgi:hypothetical protein
METAIHKSTEKAVSAYQLSSLLEWMGKDQDKFIAPYHEVGNWQELETNNVFKLHPFLSEIQKILPHCLGNLL